MTKTSIKYRLMMYFAHATFTMYERAIKSHANMSIAEFQSKNSKVIAQVCQEGMEYMEYELSSNQVELAIVTYLSAKYRPQDLIQSETL